MFTVKISKLLDEWFMLNEEFDLAILQQETLWRSTFSKGQGELLYSSRE
jgi:hypothetical protein